MQFGFVASCTQIPQVLSLKSGAKVQISWRRGLMFTIKNFLLDLRGAGLIERASKLVDRLTTRSPALSVAVFWLISIPVAPSVIVEYPSRFYARLSKRRIDITGKINRIGRSNCSLRV